MIQLQSDGKPDIELTIQKDTESDRQALVDLKRHEKLGDGVDLIYIYNLGNEQINYPKTSGRIVYIGEAGRRKRTGTRFSQHISTESAAGGDTGTNYTLSCYYWANKTLCLRIFLLDTKNDPKARKLMESQLLQLHLRTYGAHPLAQGASGERYTLSIIDNLSVPVIFEELIDL